MEGRREDQKSGDIKEEGRWENSSRQGGRNATEECAGHLVPRACKVQKGKGNRVLKICNVEYLPVLFL